VFLYAFVYLRMCRDVSPRQAAKVECAIMVTFKDGIFYLWPKYFRIKRGGGGHASRLTLPKFTKGVPL
jgi:hypothetical protein